jgi:hypothetical protein
LGRRPSFYFLRHSQPRLARNPPVSVPTETCLVKAPAAPPRRPHLSAGPRLAAGGHPRPLYSPVFVPRVTTPRLPWWPPPPPISCAAPLAFVSLAPVSAVRLARRSSCSFPPPHYHPVAGLGNHPPRLPLPAAASARTIPPQQRSRTWNNRHAPALCLRVFC